jgi:hypothetical protein
MCDNVCCKNWFPDTGYICDNCLEEFTTKIKDAGASMETVKYFTKKLNKFMSSEPGKFYVKPRKPRPILVSLDEFLDIDEKDELNYSW